VDTHLTHPEAFGQMRALSLNQLAPVGVGLNQLRWLERGLNVPLMGSHHPDALCPGELLLEHQMNKAFVSRRDPANARAQHFQ
jgi:hypothetical protein